MEKLLPSLLPIYSLHFSLFIVSIYLSNLYMSKNQKQWITFKVSEWEMSALETYCQQTQRTKTDVLRQLLRQLPTYSESGKDWRY
jgi:hypothetical protein